MNRRSGNNLPFVVPTMVEMLQERRAALVIAHPGHELRVYHWLGLVRPQVFILTDGSGHTGQSRLARTTGLLDSLGARRGSIYGRFTDGEVYSALLAGDQVPFINLAVELAEELIAHRIEYVAGDALEGYNPTHDICRFIINAAVGIAQEQGHHVDSYEVQLAYGAAASFRHPREDEITITANPEMESRKLQAAHGYSELAHDVTRIIETEGAGSLSTERLRRVSEAEPGELFNEPPFYEIHGAKQVAAGRYRQVIRYRDHVLPIALGLRRFAASKGRAQLANSNY